MTASDRPTPRTGSRTRATVSTGGRRSSLIHAVRGPQPDTAAIMLRAGTVGALAALAGLAVSVIVTVSVWATAPHATTSGVDEAVRFSVGLWLLAHHVTLDLDVGALGLTPLGLVLVPASLAYLGGRQLARALVMERLPDVGRVVVIYGLAYALTAAVVAGASGSDALRPQTGQAFFFGFGLAFGAGGWAMLRGADLDRQLWFQLPFLLRQALAGAGAALGMLAAIASLLVAVMLAIALPEGVEMMRTLRPDPLGGVALALISVAFVPNLVIWTMSLLAGPGFAVGADSEVSLRLVEYGPVPVFPPLAALPPEGEPGGWGLVLVLAPVLAGVAAGWLVHRRLPSRSQEQVAAVAAAAGVLAGLATAALGWASGGPVGGLRLAEVGPNPIWFGLIVATEVALIGAAVAWEAHRRHVPDAARPR